MSELEQVVTEDKDALIDIAHQLRSAREAMALSTSEVANNLRLDENIIKALESGDISKLTGLTYVAGYIRSYAKLLKLPADKIMEQLYAGNNENPAIVPTYLQGKAIKFKTGSNSKNIFLIILVVLAILAATWWVVINLDLIEVVKSSLAGYYQNVVNSQQNLA